MRTTVGLSVAFAAALLFGSGICSANRNREALERFSLAQLRLTVIRMPAKGDCGPPVASFQDPDGYYYDARPGNYVGELDGRISRITASEVIVVQIRKKGGEWVEVEVVLKPMFTKPGS